MSKKNNKKSIKKFNRNAYKIESLEPRLMMDADPTPTIKNWCDDIENFSDEYRWSSSSYRNEEIGGLFVAKEESLEQATYSSLLEIRSETEKWTFFSKPLAEQMQVAIDAIKTDLRNRIYFLHVPSIKTPAAEIVTKLGTAKKTVPTEFAFLTTTYGIELFESDKIKVNFSVNLEISSVPGLGYVNESAAYVLDKSYKADSSEILGLEAEYRFRRYSELYQASFVLDGNVLNGVDKESSLSLMVEFDEKAGDSAKYGVLEFNGDSDSDADLVLGAKITKTATDTFFETFSKADFDLSIKNPEHFSDDASENVFKNESSVTFKKDFSDASVMPIWSDSSIEKYNDITMGKILGKLQELSSAITNTLSLAKNRVDFGEFLSQNVNELICVSDMLKDVLNACPQSIQELIEVINKSDYSVNKNVVVYLDEQGNLVIPFNLKYIEYEFDNDGNKIIKSDYVNAVTISKNKIESLFKGLDVYVNGGVNIKSSASMSFNLVVPFAESSKAETDTELLEIGLDGDDSQIGSMLGDKAIIGSCMNRMYEGYTLNNRASSVAGKDGYCLYQSLDKSHVYYAVYCDNDDSKNIDVSGLAEFQDAKCQKGFVLNWNTKCKQIFHSGKRVHVESLEEAVDALNVIFSNNSNFGENTRAIAFNHNIVVLFDGTPEQMTYLNKGENLNIDEVSEDYDEDNLKKIWISQEIKPELFNNEIKITVTKPSESKGVEIVFEEGYFNNASCVADIAVSIQDRINKCFGWGEYSVKDCNPIELYVETFEGKIRFCTSKSYKIDFGTDLVAKWLGFSSKELDFGNSTAVKKNSICVNIKVTGVAKPIPCEVDLSDLVGKDARKTITIQQLLDRIVSSVNDHLSARVHKRVTALEQDGIELKISSSYQNFYSIDSIEDINGYSIASLLGLSGKSKSVDKNAGRNKFEIDSVIKEIYQNKKDVVKLEEFNLTIDSCVDSSKDSYNLTGNYGVFGVEINESMAGHSCKTICTLGEDNLLNENNEITVSPKYIIRSSKTNLVSHGVCVSRNDALSGDLIEDENLGMFQKTTISGMEKSIVLLNNWSLETPSDFMKYYGPNSLTMDVLYDGLYDVVSKDLMNVFFGGDDPTFLESLELPLQGKSVLDLMGLRGKINEMAKCLNQGNGSTLQELKAFFAQNLGVVLNFKLSTSGLGVDIDWTKTIQNQATELGGMDFGLGDFNLGGSVEAYLNLDLTLHTHIDIVYTEDDEGKGGFTTTLLKDVNNTYIKGSVHLSAENIVSDLNVCVAETDSEKQKTTYEKLFQIGDKDGKHSHLFMKAFVDVADSSVPGPNGESLGSRQAVAIYIGGTLYTSRYGMDTGVITIGVAEDKDDYKNLSCWDNDDNPESLAKQLGIWCEDGQKLNSVAVWDRDCDGTIYKTSEIKTHNLVVDLTELTEPLNETFLFEKLRQVADGLSDTLRRLQSNLNGVLSKKNVRSIPLLGDSILGAADCLSDLYTTLVEPFRKYVSGKYGGFDANSVAQNLYTMLVGKLDKLGTPSTVEKWAGVDFTKSYKDYIQYCESDDEVCWRMRLVGHYNLEKNKGFDLGFAGLGLKTEGGVDIDLEWTLDIGFGISKKDGAFLLLSTGRESDEKAVAAEHTIDEKGRVVTKEHAGDDFNLKLTIKPNLDLKGSLGFLAMNGHLDKDKSSFELDLGIDLNDGDNSYESVEDDWVKDQYAKEKISFSGIKSGLSVEAGLRGGVNIDLKTSLGIGGYTKEAPHIEANVVLNWSAERGTSEFGKLTEFAFRDIVFDAGAFVNNTIGNIVDKINKTIDPIRPLINFLQSEIPVLNKLPAGCFRITVLDLVKKYGESKGMNFGFLDDIIELTNVVKKFEVFKNAGIKISNGWEIYNDSLTDEQKILGLQYLNGKVSDINKYVKNAVNKFNLTDLSFVDKITDFVDCDPSDYLSKQISKWNVGESKSFDPNATPTFSADWTFPLFEKDSASKEIMKLLMGGHADLIVMDMAPLKFNFDWSKSFPIVGPLCADIGFGFGVSIDLCFGYDTYGLESWGKSGFKNTAALFNGFYMSDWDEYGNDIAEIVFHSSITAGASVCGRAGINVGLNMNLNLDFIDPNYDGKIRLSEMADMLSFNPLDTFDISASMEVTAYAYLDYFIGRKEWTLWSSGAIELFSTASKTRDPVVYTYIGDSNQEDTVVNVGEYAEYRSTGYVGDLPDVVDIAFTDAHNAMISLGYTAEDGNDYTYATTNPTCAVKGNLYVYAGDGADKIIVKGTNICHNIIVYGGEGDDVIDLSQASFAAGYYAILMGCAGNDSIFGAATGVNYVFGDEGILLYQRKSNIEEEKKLKEILVYPSESSSGNNTIIGGCNANNVIFGGFGSDTIWGGAKEDYIFGDGGRYALGTNGSLPQISAYDLFDEGGSDVIYGLDSNDFICAGAGDDFVKGGDGTDIIYAGQGDDTIHGGSGNDFIYGNDGVDVIFGDTPSNEEMVIVTKNNTAGVMPYAYASRNLTEDAKLDEVKIRSVLNDSIEEYTSSREEMKTLYSQLGFEWSTLENAVKFKVTKGMTAEAVAALNLNDTTYDEFFKDEFRSQVKKYVNGTGKTYSDVIDGGNGSDVIFGDDGAKQISGNDDIKGGAGNDFIDGDNGDDVIDGGTGDDIIYGGLGSDTLDGGADNDIVMGDDGWNAESSKSGYQKGSKEGSWFAESRNDTKKIFGDTIEAFSNNFGLNENSVSKSAGGDDIIITGSGNDIVDGQSGNDTYKVNFKGEYYSAYTNILESGNDVADSMIVNGTIWNDDILVRASDAGLGLIALLPNEDTTKKDNDANKKRIERVNYWKGTPKNGGVESVSINTGAGNDNIAVDSALSTLNVDAGAGNDTITIGQLYESKRVSNDNTKILSLDGFDGKTTETTEGYLSDGANFASSFNGGDGDDTFNMLHTSAAISLLGGAGDDNFNIASYSVEKNGEISSLKNSPVSVVGGVGDDTMTVNGTEEDDTIVYTNGTVFAPNLDIQSVGIENQNANGGNGDDEFYVLDTPKGSVYQLNGNNGNDSFYNGGAQTEDGKPKVIDLKSDVQINQDDISVLFVGPDNKESYSLAGAISELDKIFEYGVKLSKAPKAGETVCITIFAPVVSEENHQRGDKGILFADGENYTSFVTLTFDSSDYSTVKKVQLKAFADKLSEGDAYFALLHKVQIEGNTVTSKVNDCKNVLVFMDDKNSLQPKNAFTETLEHRIGKNEHSFDVHLNALPLNSDITIWTNSHKKIEGLKWDRVGNKLTVEWTNDLAEGTIFYINYSHNSMVVENTSVLQMKYNAQESLKNNKIYLAIRTNDSLLPKYDSDQNECSYEYDINAKKLDVHRGTMDQKQFNLSGFLYCMVKQPIASKTVNFTLPLLEDGISVFIKNEKDEYEKVSYVLSEDQTTLELDTSSTTIEGYITYATALEINGASTDRDVISLWDKLNGLEFVDDSYTPSLKLDENYEVTSQRNATEDGYFYKTSGNQLIICSNKTGKPVTVSGTFAFYGDCSVLVANEKEKNELLGDMPESITVSKNTIENILGSVYENGAGDMNDFASSPMMLRYKELNKSDDRKEIDEPSEADKKRMEELAKKIASFDETKSIDRVFMNNMDNSFDAMSSLAALEKGDSVDAKLLASDSESVRFTHTDQSHENAEDDFAKNISFGNMEYGEINLGTGEDTVDISKSIYREDGFQTFTVVNSGKGGDTINVNSYKAEEETLVCNISKQFAITAKVDDKYTYVLTAKNGGVNVLPFNVETIGGKNGKVYLVAVFSDGVERRAEVDVAKTTVNSIALLHAFDGVTDELKVVSARFAMFKGSDDQLVINAGEDDDKILATDTQKVTKSGLIAFGGLGNDKIEIKSDSSLVFGDRGQVLYHDAEGNVVTRLGDDKTGTFIGKEKGVARNAGGSDYATGKKKGDEAYYQTDGTRYGASIARTVTEEQGGNDTITLGGGRNVVFGGENKNEVIDKDEKLVVSKYGIDNITTGNGDDFILGDNGYTTFQGRSDVAKGLDMENMPTIYEESTISFNFQGDAQNGFEANDSVGAPGYESKNWVNIKGSLASTYGNDDSEIVRFDNGTRASAISLSYNGNEDLRFSSSDNAINLQTYNHWLSNRDQDNAAKLMNSGLMSTAPNNQNGNKVNVAIDGLAQYYESYKVVVYLDLPDANSWERQSVRIVSLFIDGKREQAYYVNDPAPKNFEGSFENHAVQAILNTDGSIKGVKRIKNENGVEVETVEPIDDEFGRAMLYSSYVVFDVGANIASDRIVIRVEDGIQDPNYNGKDIPGIAAIQIKGVHHKQDVAATTNIDFGGRDVIHSGRGDDIVAGGTDADTIETFGDDHRGIDDNDIVFGDNAKMVFVDRDGNDETASTISSAESIAVKNLDMSYNDVIDTGDGNDTIVGGVGQDTIHSGATAAAEDMQDGVKALSINFTRDDADDSMKIREATYVTYTDEEIKNPDLILGTHYVVDGCGNNIAIDENGKKIIATNGETAGIVADYDWHNMYVKNRELHEFVDYSSHTVDGVDVAISSYENPWQEYWADNASMINNISDELDGDTSNSKLYHNYLAAQKQEEIKLTLDHLDTFRSHNGLESGAYCDLYVYLGGDNNDVHIYDHIYDISLTWYDKSGNKCKTEHRFLNDWTGYNFDGDYKEAYCTSYTEAVDMLHKDSAVCVRIIGNYVVFHNISVDKVDVRIKNVYTHTRGNQNPNENGEQNPKNLPLINAVQIVAGSGKEDAAIGGDHDKDLVFGDDAKLTFDIDVPYAVDEKMADYKNRVVEAESVAIADNVVKKLSTDDIIDTGKDRDVVVGGEGSDNITTGSGDDIAIGGSANLMVEHNNPLGVFTPSVEIVLDQHTIDTNNHQGYLDHHCNNPQEAEQAVRDFQGLLDQGQIKGIQIIDNKNDRLNTFDLGEGRDLQSTGSNDPSELVNQNDDEEQNGNQGSENPVINEDDQIDYDKTVISPVAYAQLNLVANEKVKLVLESYPKSDDYTPNLWVFVSPQVPGQSFEDVCIELYSDGKLFSYDIEGGFWKSQDVPDHIDGDPTFKDGNCVVYVSSKVNTNVTVQVAEGG